MSEPWFFHQTGFVAVGRALAAGASNCPPLVKAAPEGKMGVSEPTLKGTGGSF